MSNALDIEGVDSSGKLTLRINVFLDFFSVYLAQ